MPRGRPFPKGHKKSPKSGRKPGVRNKVTREIRTFFAEMANDPKVQDAFKAQVVRGDRGSMQAFLGVAAHIIGKPKETLQVETTPNMAKLLLLALKGEVPPPQKPAA